MEIYLDNSATTKPYKEVIDKMVYALDTDYANPSSLHRKGVEVEKNIKNIRQSIARTLGAKDKILYKKANENGEIIEEKPIAINALNFSGHCYIDFYTLNCTGITFRFNKKPIAANFNIDESKITDLDYIHHFFIECDDNFTFD